MSGFKITQKIDENMKTRIQIDGAMDEHSDYSSIEEKFTDEVAVMIDTRDALEIGEITKQVENPDYVYSWQEK